ncbi:MAG: NAD-dependent epimerase/dehydratase family protein [Bacteroidetes bacterium]|nr:NAD-dependent epimerase/dehydratase family protein [Bacteroidota bacterium]
MNSVFVTGGTGFLGAYIISELVGRNYQVKALRRSQKLPFFIPADILSKVEWVEGDILDISILEKMMEECDIVVHAAAKVSSNPAERKEMYKTNIDGTTNIVNVAIEKKIKKLVYVSSVSALGTNEDGGTIDEGKQWEEKHLQSHYAISKYHAEMEVWRGMAEGLHAVIVNPSTILGFGDWNNTSCALFKSSYDEFPWYTEGVNGFVDVRDTAKAVVMLLQSDIGGERFLISSENWSFHRLLDTISDGFTKKRPHLKATPFLAALAWRWEKLKSFFSGSSPLLTKENARSAQGQTYYDSRKIQQYFPDFTFTPLEQTIRKACQDYLFHVTKA